MRVQLNDAVQDYEINKLLMIPGIVSSIIESHELKNQALKEIFLGDYSLDQKQKMLKKLKM